MQQNYTPKRSPAVTQDSGAEKPVVSKPGIGKTFGLVAIMTVLSKFVGLARDVVINSYYGTGIVADAFNFAYMFTGNIFVLFGGLGGPFHSATVTVLGSRKDDPKAGTMITQVFVYTFVGLSVITTLLALAAPLIAAYYGSTYVPKGVDLLAGRQLLREQFLQQLLIMLPLVVLAGLVGISYGIVNVFNKVVWPSLSPAIASVAVIVAIVFFSNSETRIYTGVPLAIGTAIGAFGQLFAQLPGTLTTGLAYKFRLGVDEGFKEYCSMLWPAIFSTSVGFLTVYVDMFFTVNYLEEGSWTAIVNSNRLVQLPLGVLLTAMLVPILPRFTEQATSGALLDLKEELRRSLRFLWFLALPLAAIFFVLPTPIIKLLFERDAFNEHSTALVSWALLFLAPSIFFYVARDLMTRVFYAFKDSNTPYRVALIAIFIKAALDWFFVTQTNLGVGGLSSASTLMTLINLALLTYFLKKKIGNLGFVQLVKPVGTMLIAAALCGAVVWGVFSSTDQWLQTLVREAAARSPLFAKLSFLPLVLSLGASCSIGMITYWIACLGGRLEEPQMLTKRVPVLKRFAPPAQK